MVGNLQECRARSAPVIAVCTDGDEEIVGHASDLIRIPASTRFTTPITATIALQLLAYSIARERGCSIDQPRNLAKSVTVE
jgi:glucosamine--fructose-6-phosphate aminotransferase (isomerizing)